MREPWWRLTADQFRIAMTLVAIAEFRDGAARVTASTSDFERFFGMPRSKIRRALEALERAGFCQIWSSKGRAGTTSVVLRDARPFNSTIQRAIPERLSETQDADMVCESLADLGDRGHLPGTITGTITSSDSDDLAIRSGNHSGGRAPDQDLQRSSPDLGSDLRPPDPVDLTSNTKKSPIEKLAAPWVDEAASQPGSDAETTTARSRLDPDAIPDRAWAAADYLRAQVLAENRAAFVGTKPWESGWEFPAAGKPIKVGDGSRSGLRLSWANAFRLLNGKVVAAMKNADPKVTEADAWSEIARTVRWLFLDQPVEPRFVVESPDSLREKWDNIQRNRANRARADAQPKARGADNRPDPQAAREFKRW